VSTSHLRANPLRVADSIVVGLAYELQDSEGEWIDSADELEPLEFICGFGQILPGLERNLYGMVVGDEKKIVVAPEDAYGEFDPEAYDLASLDWFPSVDELEIGMSVEVEDSDGETVEAYIAEIRDDGVVLDFNHPLAGETLYFNAKIVSLRQATAEELDHGHVHGATGHHS
jgi:FKBP-type peptidyl-prolyl cis-trans isomerase SlyD